MSHPPPDRAKVARTPGGEDRGEALAGRLGRLSRLGLFVGVLLFTGIVAWQGVGAVARALGEAGWGILLVVPLFLVPLLFASLSWRALLPSKPNFGRIVRGSWYGLAANWLLPVAQVGGEVVRAAYLARRGTPAEEATASVVVDKTVQVAALVLTSIAGAWLLAAGAADGGAVLGALLGAILLGLGGWGFYRAQRRGVFSALSGVVGSWMERAGAGPTGGWTAAADRTDRLVRALYDARGRVGSALLWRLLFRVGMAAEIWVVLHLLGLGPSLADALVLEFLGQAIRAAAFVVPGGLGVQEGGFMALGAALGYPPSAGLVVSLGRRVRELGVGVPALLAWQLAGGWPAAARGPDRQRAPEVVSEAAEGDG